MKVVAFNGSPRKKGNTYHAIQIVFKELIKDGIDTELIQLGGSDIKGCIACLKCIEKKNKRCVQKDSLNLYLERMIEADGIIIGSPTYFSNVSTEVKALIDRAGLVSIANDYLLRRKTKKPDGKELKETDEDEKKKLINRLKNRLRQSWNIPSEQEKV